MSLTTGTTYLLIAKVQLDVSGSNDQIDFWLKSESDDISSELALGSPLITRNDADAFGSTFDQVGVSFSASGDKIDAIRLSNDADAFQTVVGIIPEPASLVLLGLGGLVLTRRCLS